MRNGLLTKHTFLKASQQFSPASLQKLNEVGICQLTSYPLAPDNVIGFLFGHKVLQAAMEELSLVVFTNVLYGRLDEVLVLYQK